MNRIVFSQMFCCGGELLTEFCSCKLTTPNGYYYISLCCKVAVFFYIYINVGSCSYFKSYKKSFVSPPPVCAISPHGTRCLFSCREGDSAAVFRSCVQHLCMFQPGGRKLLSFIYSCSQTGSSPRLRGSTVSFQERARLC